MCFHWVGVFPLRCAQRNSIDRGTLVDVSDASPTKDDKEPRIASCIVHVLQVPGELLEWKDGLVE